MIGWLIRFPLPHMDSVGLVLLSSLSLNTTIFIFIALSENLIPHFIHWLRKYDLLLLFLIRSLLKEILVVAFQLMLLLLLEGFTMPRLGLLRQKREGEAWLGCLLHCETSALHTFFEGRGFSCFLAWGKEAELCSFRSGVLFPGTPVPCSFLELGSADFVKEAVGSWGVLNLNWRQSWYTLNVDGISQKTLRYFICG